MREIRRILHPTDFTENAEAAFTHAIALARRFDAEMHLLHTVASFGPSRVLDDEHALREPDLYYQHLWETADHRMQQLVRQYEAQDLVIRRLHARGLLPAPVILEYAQQSAIDLIVLGAHGHHYHPHALGSSAAEVLCGAPCPVYFARGRFIPHHDDSRQRILLPIDTAQPTDETLRMTATLAARFDADVDLLHVIDPALQVSEISVDNLMRGDRALGDQLRARLARCREHDTRNFDITFTTLTGVPSTEIQRFAHYHRSDLIVLAAPALSRTKYYPQGSLTEHVVSDSQCPVFVLRPQTSPNRVVRTRPEANFEPLMAPPSMARKRNRATAGSA